MKWRHALVIVKAQKFGDESALLLAAFENYLFGFGIVDVVVIGGLKIPACSLTIKRFFERASCTVFLRLNGGPRV